MTETIQVQNLTRRYGDLIAVDDVSFSIGRGEVVGLLGHNGAGKTTVMKMLTGFLEPTAGTIRVEGHDMNRDRSTIQARIGYLPENCPLWPEMTVVDYLDYQAALHHVPAESRNAAIAHAIARAHLAEKATVQIGTLSRGYRQRVGVAQAILHRPAIIILDEPTNGLDPQQIRDMRGLIADLAKDSTVIVSSHILQEVQAICERVLIMNRGRLVLDSRLDALRAGRRMLVSVDRDAREVLGRVHGVRGVEARTAADGHMLFAVDADAEHAPVLADAIHAAGIRLYGLQTERRDLETVFAEVTEHRTPHSMQTDKEVAHVA
ncbi:MAG TPA: ABC transporter ATP-binding protein [Rhodocyclaceae bacterium]|nr:ABC transporter ATP-binding protein [Rhodocyclaceae bacterium]